MSLPEHGKRASLQKCRVVRKLSLHKIIESNLSEIIIIITIIIMHHFHSFYNNDRYFA